MKWIIISVYRSCSARDEMGVWPGGPGGLSDLSPVKNCLGALSALKKMHVLIEKRNDSGSLSIGTTHTGFVDAGRLLLDDVAPSLNGIDAPIQLGATAKPADDFL